MMMEDKMERIGIKRGDYDIRVKKRKVIEGVIEEIGIEGEGNEEKSINVLREIEKIEKLGKEGVRIMIGKGSMEESGEFKKGEKLKEEEIEKVMELKDEGGEDGEKKIENIKEVVEGNEKGEEGVKEMEEMKEMLLDGGYEGRVKIDK